MKNLDDRHIIAIANGDIEAFKGLYDNLFRSMCVFAYSLLKEKKETEDIVQDSFIVYWNRRADFRKIDNVKAFLYTIVRNKCLNMLRDKKAADRYVDYIKNDHSFFFKNEIIKNETYTTLNNAISELPDQTRKIMELSLKGLINKEIAQELNVSVNTIKTLKQNGYKVLREKLSGHLYALILLHIIIH